MAWIDWRGGGAVLFLLAAAGAAPAADISKLAWLGGCWKSDNGEAGSSEYWMAPAGGTMIGVGRTVKGGRTVAFEYMQIRTQDDGQLAFVATPSGQKTAAFPVLRQGDDEVVFENLQHDFPQRVAYRRDGASRLRARIEGLRNGTLRTIEFPMTRASCEP